MPERVDAHRNLAGALRRDSECFSYPATASSIMALYLLSMVLTWCWLHEPVEAEEATEGGRIASVGRKKGVADEAVFQLRVYRKDAAIMEIDAGIRRGRRRSSISAPRI
jgi:hypothetical protein